VSTPIILVQEKQNQSAAFAFLAVYDKPSITLDQRRTNLLGFVLGVYRIGEVADLTLKELQPQGISYKILDVTDPNKIQEIHRHKLRRLTGTPSYEEGLSDAGNLRDTREFVIGGRKWRFEGFGLPQYLPWENAQWPPMSGELSPLIFKKGGTTQ
jgi:hypothetical protein